MTDLSGLELDLVRVLRGAKRCKPVRIGPVNFYHFWSHSPQYNLINVPWIKDLRIAQFAQAGYVEDYLQQAQHYLVEDRQRFAPVHAFVAPTATFAAEVNRWYAPPGGERPWFSFANYPDRTRLSNGPRRHEVVYVDYASTVFQEEFYRTLYGFFDHLHVLCGVKAVLLVNTFRRDVEALPHGPHVSVRSLRSPYDGLSRYGLLVNVTNFKQAAECLPRKLLLYCHWGLTPAIHGTFDESLRFCHKRGVRPVVYWGVKELAGEMITRARWGDGLWKKQAHDREQFCIEERIGDLARYLRSLA